MKRFFTAISNFLFWLLGAAVLVITLAPGWRIFLDILGIGILAFLISYFSVSDRERISGSSNDFPRFIIGFLILAMILFGTEKWVAVLASESSPFLVEIPGMTITPLS